MVTDSEEAAQSRGGAETDGEATARLAEARLAAAAPDDAGDMEGDRGREEEERGEKKNNAQVDAEDRPEKLKVAKKILRKDCSVPTGVVLTAVLSLCRKRQLPPPSPRCESRTALRVRLLGGGAGGSTEGVSGAHLGLGYECGELGPSAAAPAPAHGTCTATSRPGGGGGGGGGVRFATVRKVRKKKFREPVLNPATAVLQ
ncbi:Protein of unknown function [Gryllus bimaculatus]|nr:Protein of unknown function [Gryllus bimaculatus]